ncbi:MAG: hypothetical protein FJ306_03550 [Planctomycetes bacterium]|nr:hypothetical protein [Planctomycetota bacterium]
MNRALSTLLSLTVAAAMAAHASAQVTLTPVAGFGNNGWMAPGSIANLATSNSERGLAYNPVTGNLVLVSRTGGNNVRILDGASGADLGGLDLTGISGGTFAVNMTGVADDGSIYVANLAIFNATTNPVPLFKVYRWNDEVSGLTTAPLVAFSGTPGAQRIGDSFAVNGGTGATPLQFAAAGSAVLTNANTTIGSNFAIGQLDFSNTAVQYGLIAGTTSAGSNDYRLGITWRDDDTVIGSQGINGRITTFDPVTQTAVLDNTIALGGAPRRAMDFAVIGGLPLLAVLDSNNSVVTIFDITNPQAPLVMASGTTTTGALVANGNGTGSVAWGAINGTSARLYAMNSNQGIQAFNFSFGPLASATAYGVGCEGLTLGNTGVPMLGSSAFSLDVGNVPVFAPLAFVAFGSLPINPGVDLSGIGMPGCFSYTTFDLNLYQTGPVVNQIGSFVLPIPANTALAGSTLAAQGVSLSIVTSLGLNASNGLTFTVGF